MLEFYGREASNTSQSHSTRSSKGFVNPLMIYVISRWETAQVSARSREGDKGRERSFKSQARGSEIVEL